jgi:hypothetical protein
VRQLALVLFVVACHPSVSVQNATAIGNLQAVHSVGLRVHSSAFASQGVAMMMEQSIAGHLQQRCSFEQIAPAAQVQSDLVLDINILGNAHGSSWNGSKTSIDALVVLSDIAGDPLGTAKLHGESGGSVMGGGGQDSEAIDAIAKTIADILVKSGCSGPRLARVAPDPVPATGSDGATGSDTTPDDAKRAQAEQLNDQGKARLFQADMQGALGLFQQAVAVVPDAKYQFNVCVALGGMEQWDAAIAACNQAKTMNPTPKLSAKIDQRMDGLVKHQ